MKKMSMLALAALLLSTTAAWAQGGQPTDDTNWAPSGTVQAAEDQAGRDNASDGAASSNGAENDAARGGGQQAEPSSSQPTSNGQPR